MKHIFGKNKGEEHNFWMSYTDLMSGFLIIFIITSLIMFNQYEKEKQAYTKMCEILNVENPDSLRNKIIYLENIVDSIKSSNLNNEIDKYKDVFKSTDEISVKFDSIRGSIILKHQNPTKELFESGKASLYREEDNTPLPLKPYLDQIYTALVDTTIAIAKTHKNVEIRIEGHTDPTWNGMVRGGRESYIKNLDLSSRRANTVFEYILNGSKLNEEQRKFIMKHMISVGYSFSERVGVGGDSLLDELLDPSSRRIEFRIISK